MKIGDMVVCKNRFDHISSKVDHSLLHLTPGKKYRICHIENQKWFNENGDITHHTIYRVINDIGDIDMYMENCFISLQEHRESILKSIIR